MTVIGPQPGPQTIFAATPADVAIYGGAAGGGKSWALLFEAARGAHVPGYAGIVFRKHLTNIVGPGGLFDASRQLYPKLGARAKGSPKPEWIFPNGTRIGFDHLEHESSAELHQGAEYAFIGFDELTHFSERQFFYLTSRSRSTCGVRPYVRATCNPDPDSFVRKLIDWWIDPNGSAILERAGALRWYVRDGDLLAWGDSREEMEERFPQRDERGDRKFQPKSFTFVPASLDDNPALTSADPGYRATLMAMPRVDRERLLGGNWNIRPAAGMYFKRAFFEIVDRIPGRLTKQVRAWDKAATATAPGKDPDWTRGVKVGRLEDGRAIVLHLESLRGRPLAVDQAMRTMAVQDGIECEIASWQDPGQAGIVDIEHTRSVLSGFRVHIERASKDKVTYAGPVSSDAEARRILLLKGPWNDEFIAELEAFPSKEHDDIVDALSLAHLRMNNAASLEQQASAYGKGW